MGPFHKIAKGGGKSCFFVAVVTNTDLQIDHQIININRIFPINPFYGKIQQPAGVASI